MKLGVKALSCDTTTANIFLAIKFKIWIKLHVSVAVKKNNNWRNMIPTTPWLWITVHSCYQYAWNKIIFRFLASFALPSNIINVVYSRMQDQNACHSVSSIKALHWKKQEKLFWLEKNYTFWCKTNIQGIKLWKHYR